jgi:hypothetical protein
LRRHQSFYKFVFRACTALYRPVPACTSPKTLKVARPTCQVFFFAIPLFLGFARQQFCESLKAGKMKINCNLF